MELFVVGCFLDHLDGAYYNFGVDLKVGHLLWSLATEEFKVRSLLDISQDLLALLVYFICS